MSVELQVSDRINEIRAMFRRIDAKFLTRSLAKHARMITKRAVELLEQKFCILEDEL